MLAANFIDPGIIDARTNATPGQPGAGVGPDVDGWQAGDRVVGVTGNGGGMAQFVTGPVNPFQLVRIPDGVSFEEAATTEPLADGLQMARKAAIGPGRTCWYSTSVSSASV